MAERRGTVLYSVEQVQATPNIYELERVISRILTPGFADMHAELHYSAGK